jgi:phosphonate transport system substrate-binding protein
MFEFGKSDTMAASCHPAAFVRTATLTFLTLLLVACCPGDQTDERGWPNELVLGLVPSLEAEAMVDNLEPLAEFLSEELDMPVTSFVPQDYTGLVEALGTGRADIGMLPPFAAMLGQRRYDIETILISVRNGETGYRSQFMTNDPSVCDTPVVEDELGYKTCEGDIAVLEGETVAFTDPNSTSGFLFPSVKLMKAGIDPQKDVDGLFVGGHDSAALAVYAGDVRFATAYDDVRMFIEDQYPDIGEKVITFAFTEMIPNDGVQVRPGLPEDLQEAIKNAFVKLTEEQADLPREEKVLWVLYEIDGFVEATPGLYDPVRDAYELMRE